MKTDDMPRSFEEFKALVEADRAFYLRCAYCKLPFSQSNTRSMMGWRETQISGLCEDCFDKVTQENDDDQEDNDRASDPAF